MPKLLKRTLIAMGILAVLGIALGTVMSTIPTVPAMAKGFFMAIGQKNYSLAYIVMSTEFKENATEKDFEMMLKSTGLATAKDWSTVRYEADINKKEGFVEGFTTIQDRSGEKRINLTLELVFEHKSMLDQGWKINAITPAQNN